MDKVDQKRYDLINQCYAPFVYSHAQIDRMPSVTDKDRTIFWCPVSKKYLIFEHTLIIGGVKVKLKAVKNLNAVVI